MNAGEIARIREEETLRVKIRAELESGKQRPSRAWEILNSSFVLWALSSIVVAGVTSVYSCYQERRVEGARASDVLERMDLEIARRMEELRYNLAIVEVSERGRAKLRQTLDAMRKTNNPMFQEFAQRPLSSLLFEYCRYLTGKPQQSLWSDLTEKTRALEGEFLSEDFNGDVKPILDRAKVLLTAYDALDP